MGTPLDRPPAVSASAESLTELLRVRSAESPAATAYTFLADDESRETAVTYAEMDRQARAVAAWLQAEGLQGRRVLLLYPPGRDYALTFLGCLYAGAVAVPAYPPRRNRSLGRLRAIAADAGAAAALTGPAVYATLAPLLAEAPELSALRWLVSEPGQLPPAEAWREFRPSRDTLAFLQYTSGSTATPRGVMLTHGNLLHNLAGIASKFGPGAARHVVCWLPPYHDMGLIGGILQPIYMGGQVSLLAPAAFLQQPLRWLEAISRARAVTSGGPNFAYDLCLRRVSPEQRDRLDLSSWSLAFTGAEPVRAATLEAFAEFFAPCGFRREAFYPCYGLAEATLLVAGGYRDTWPQTLAVDAGALERNQVVAAPDDPRARRLVSNGRSLADQNVLIIDPETRVPCPPDGVGEVWVGGPSVAAGYWNNEYETAATFRACLADGAGPFLRTGDLGFVRDGELFVTGRLKDLIIIDGRNHYPQDVELTVEQSHPALLPAGGAVFAVAADGEERLVAVQELGRQHIRADLAPVLAAARQAVLDEHGVPLWAVVLIRPATLPRTSSGKVRRKACRQAFLAGELEVVKEWRATAPAEPAHKSNGVGPRTDAPAGRTVTRDEVRAWLVDSLSRRLGVPAVSVNPREPFAAYGLSSREAVVLSGELAEWLGRPVPPVLVYECPTPEALAAYLAEGRSAAEPAPVGGPAGEPIALIGIGCRFPGAHGPAAFWRLLREGTQAVTEVPAGRWDPKYFDGISTRALGTLGAVDRFDAGFFGISPREAARMDPQQRLLLQTAYEALEDAGLSAERLAGTRTGVFVGISGSDYGRLLADDLAALDVHTGTGNALCVAANRLSYFFGWHGPSLAVDTACSSSLVAVHLACEAIWRGEAPLALAAGVNLVLSPTLSVYFSRAGFLSPEGRCKAFDAGADGYVRGEGAGVVVLKPLSRALADGDPIRAVIRGSAVNQDGRSNGLTAPSRHAQEDVLRSAYRRGGVAPGEVDYVEAHGTGTALGDPIEALALGTVLAEGRERPCLLGSVKTNIGHLEAAAGVAGLIKAALALEHREVPPSLHFREPNPHILFDRLPLRVVTEASPWPKKGGPALAGVSSFGFGGTNAHVVLQEPPRPEPAPAAEPSAYLLPLSAHDPAALRDLARSWAELLRDERPGAPAPHDLCYSAALRRGHLAHRLAVAGRDRAELAERLLAAADRETVAATEPPKVVFVFSGQGAEWRDTGRALLDHEPAFRDAFEECERQHARFADWSLRAELTAEPGRSRLSETEFAQPVLFAVQVALAAQWRAWGIVPAAVVGHSVGEIAAAHVAGVLTLPEAAALVAHRARLMQSASGKGQMAAVGLSEEESAGALAGFEGRVSVAALNAPGQTVLAGEPAALAEVLTRLKGRGVAGRRLPVRVAFHSPDMDDLCDPLQEFLKGLSPRSAAIPLYSTVTGGRLDGSEMGADYWARNMRDPVRFATAVGRLTEAGHDTFLEISPHPILASAVARCRAPEGKAVRVFPSLKHDEDGSAALLGTLGSLYALGCPVAWPALFPRGGRCVPLPSYPWQEQSYWLPGATPREAAAQAEPAADAPGDWLYEFAWETADRIELRRARPADAGAWLIFADRQGVAESFAESLASAGQSSCLVFAAEDYAEPRAGCFHVRPGNRDDLRRVLDGAFGAGQPPCRGVLHLWSLDESAADEASLGGIEAAQAIGCASVVPLVQEMARGARPARLWLVTRGAQAVAGGDAVAVAQAPLWGFGRTLAYEHPTLWGGLIDLDPGEPPARAASRLREEVGGAEREDQVAFRGGRRLVPRLVRHRADGEGAPLRPRADGTYLITGGLGDLGLEVARWMVRHGARRLILMARTALPPRSAWGGLPADGRPARLAAAVRELEALGASVHLAAVDVADETCLRGFLSSFADEGWPPIRGVVHAAGLVRDQPIAGMEAADLADVFRPKVAGAWLLHRLVEERAPLDFFVMFSSAAALIGAPGQAGYAAANAFLDALAFHRRAQGRPALSINWGPWAEVGMAAERMKGRRFAEHGMGAIPPSQGLALFRKLAGNGATQMGVLPIDWDKAKVVFPPAWRDSLLRHLLGKPAEGPGAAEGPSRAALLAAEPGQRPRLLEAFLREQTARVMGHAPERVDVRRPLTQLGLDSLMALELKNRLEVQLGVPVPVVDFIRGPSIVELSRDILNRLGACAPASAEAAPAPTPAEGALSVSQQALWFLHQFDPTNAGYNLCFTARVPAEVNADALRHALAELLRRHPVLRSCYPAPHGKPARQTLARAEVAFEVIDASGWGDGAAEAHLAREMSRPFDLENGPVLRGVLLRRTAAEHFLGLSLHHIAGDFRSLAILLDEVRVLYAAACEGGSASLPTPAADYADFVRWQDELLAGPEGERLWAFWQRQLAGELPVLNLPANRPRPARPTSRGATHVFRFGEGLTRRLGEFARAEGVTLYTLLLAAYDALLFRFTGQETVLVGSPVSSRSRPEFAEVVGYFANMLVHRADCGGDPSFRGFLGRVRESVLAGLAHKDYPFAALVERLQPRRAAGHTPVFQTVFALERPHRGAGAALSYFSNGRAGGRLDLGGLPLESVVLADHPVAFDLSVLVEESEDGLVAFWQYNTDLFDPETVARLAAAFNVLAEGILASPDRPLSELPLLDEAEYQTVVRAWNDTRAEFPACAVAELVEQQAARTPDRVAVRFIDRTLTYDELNRLANRIAHHLRALGAGPDVLVGLCVERSTEMVAAALGILKAGAAYVPLDPAYPDERLAFYVEDSRMPLVLTEEPLLGRLPQRGARVVCLDRDRDAIAARPADNPPPAAGPECLAYVIYTSGSTGRPKGVQIPHRALVNFLCSVRRRPGLNADDVLLAVTTLSFDIHALEVWLPLITGARVVVAGREEVADGARLLRLLGRSGATVFQATPATFRMLLAAGWDGAPSLKLLCGGEALTEDLAGRLLPHAAELWNMYGPTETTVWSTAARVTSAEGAASVGRPLDNTQVYVLDRHQRPVPVGVPGELCLGGAGLARGYLNRPELTAEKFVADPFDPAPDARLYRTGDLARWRRDGTLDFLGRLDNQVKIRGYRIEPGEIETALVRHPAVAAAAVMAREDAPGDRRLVAYVVPRQAQAYPVPELADFMGRELRRHLLETLPEYMVPSAFVLLDALPLAPNGKLDRRALPAPAGVPSPAGPHEAPRTPTEKALADIWADILRVERVGRDDNFYDLGGHSLLATQVVARVAEAFGVEVALRDLLESPTVAGLAAAVDRAPGRRAVSPVSSAPFHPRPAEGALPLSFNQETLWFYDRLSPGNPAYNLPAVIRLVGPLNLPALRRVLDALAERHESLRFSFPGDGGRPAVHVAPPAAVPLPIHDLADLPAGEREGAVKALANEEARKSFDLAHGPIWRTSLLRLGEQEHVLLLTVHHIVADGWSAGVLTRDFALLYQAFVEGKPSPLPPLSVQYLDFACSQRRWLEGGLLRPQQDYWAKQLAGSPPVLALPTDRPRPDSWTFNGAQLPVKLAAPLTAALKAFSRQEGVTPFMTLLAALQTLLHRYSGQTDICVGSPIANRNRIELEGLVGLFINTLVFRTDLSGEPSFRHLLRRVQEVALGAYAHQDLPFEQVVRAVQPVRDVRHPPLFQVLLVLQNAPIQVPLMAGLTPSVVLQADNGTAKFDLSLGLTDTTEGLMGSLEYNTDLFDRATAERLLGHLTALLEGALADPDRPIAGLPLLPDAERRQLLAAWDAPPVPGLGADSFADLFEKHAALTPGAPAASCGADRRTYAELNDCANVVARRLIDEGIGREGIVALLAERGLDFLTAVLGVFKAGAAYLPLDPKHPPARQAQIVGQGRPALVLVARAFRPALDEAIGGLEPDGRPGVLVIEDLLQEPCPAADNPPRSAGPRDLAYVIYTSGSTGLPKGAMIEQGGMLNHLLAKVIDLGLTAADVVAQNASQCFDISVWQYLAPLAVGGRVHVVADEPARDPALLLAETERGGVTVLEAVPSLARALLAALPPAGPPAALRWLILTGEALPPDLARRWLERCPHLPLMNAYGPTECSDDVTHHVLRQPPPADAVRVPIGRPVANLRLCVLDGLMQPLPLGVPGEIYVGGAGVGRGYLHDAERTAAAFVTDPFAAEPGARLYRTGDLGRARADGTFEFLGRIDHQVKVRGFRIELGEIESALRRHPEIAEAVVVVHEGGPADKRLIAYVVAGADTSPSPAALRSFLKESLPEHMIPSAFVRLPALPLTANGKVDRRALPAADLGRPDLEREYVAPRTPAEERLAGLWAEVLGVKRVGVYDNFFDLGGDSILAIQIIARAQEAGLALSPQQMFQHQTVAELAPAAVAAVGPDQAAPPEPLVRLDRADLDRLLGEGAGIEDVYPLAPAQQGILFHTLYAPDSAVYFVQLTCTLAAGVDGTALRQAWQLAGDRHAILRTSFLWEGVAEPLQVVHPRAEVPWQELDWSDAAPDEFAARLDAFLADDRRRDFDLARPPLLRLALIRGAEGRCTLVWSTHHLLMDGWSGGLLLKDVFTAYALLREGRQPAAAPVRPYRDYIAWLGSQDPAAPESFWRDALRGFTAPTPLTIDAGESADTWGEREVRLPRETTAQLREFARRQRLTLNTLVQGAWAVLLARYGGLDDVVFGTTVSGRPASLPGCEAMIGLFINTLPVRLRVPDERPLLGWLQDVQDSLTQIREFESTPLVRVQEWSDVPRGRPLFESLVVFENHPIEAGLVEFGRQLGIETASAVQRTNYPLTLTAVPGDELLLNVSYAEGRFAPDAIDRLLGHLQTVLGDMAAHPEKSLGELCLLTEAERRQLLVEWNATRTEESGPACLHQWFEEQAARTPDAAAVLAEGVTLTYRELDHWANGIAHALRRRGVGPETVVALALERSPRMVAAVLGVLKAGGAYLPLDRAYPPERLAFMVKDAAATLLLTDEGSLPDAVAAAVPVVRLDSDAEFSAGADLPPAGGAGAESLAYVIYTSGSTGQPKGIAIPHRGIVNRMRWGQEAFRLGEPDRVLQTSSFSFDASVCEIFAPFMAGAALVLARPRGELDAAYLAGLIAERRVTVATFTPALLDLFLEEPGLAACTSLRHVICGGEAMTPELRDRFFARSSAALHNYYGPTETSIDATAWTCRPGDPPGPVPIGRPIANVEAYILDPHLRPVPVGVPGELCVGGAGLARGYLNRPELTAAKFIAHPFRAEPGAQLYRTGDRARHRPDGAIEYLGRLDGQVKLHGLRVETGEIEAALLRQPGVRQAVALVRAAANGDRSLVAYVVSDRALDAAGLRRSLADWLPEWMVPSAVVFLDALPLTPNGKVDQRALPAPDAASAGPRAPYVAPRTPLERQMADLWQEVLGVERVGIHDDFFALGGHSLLAMKLAARMSAALKGRASVRQVFLHPTIAVLAEALETAAEPDTAPPSEAAAVLPAETSFMKIERRPLLTLHAAGRLAAVDAAAIGYLPGSLLALTGMDARQITHEWLADTSLVTHVVETPLGRVAGIMLPRLDCQLYDDPDDLLRSLTEALHIARHIGARSVSLTGLLASATDYGRALPGAGTDLPRVTTGHATTTAAVALALKRTLAEAGRDLTEERLAFLGLGSVGVAALRLVLTCLPHPTSLLLCDVYSKEEALQALRRELADELGYHGPIEIHTARAGVPDALYEAGVIVGATNVADILDVERLRPGTLMVDDSGPHCFRPEQMIERFRSRHDVLFTEGGMLRSPEPMPQLIHMPPLVERLLPAGLAGLLPPPDPHQITGCVLSALLSSRFAELPPHVGLVDLASCVEHLRALERLGFGAAALQCEDYVLDGPLIEQFRRRHGRGATP